MIKTNLCPLHLCNSYITIRPSVLELQGILNGENVKEKKELQLKEWNIRKGSSTLCLEMVLGWELGCSRTVECNKRSSDFEFVGMLGESSSLLWPSSSQSWLLIGIAQ